jgi:hypothetical protein
MAFKVLFMAHAPDADSSIHRSMIETGLYQLTTIVVKGQEDALEICRTFVIEASIDSILLCPGFTHADVAEIAALVGNQIGVSVARGDGPSNKLSAAVIQREWYSIEK